MKKPLRSFGSRSPIYLREHVLALTVCLAALAGCSSDEETPDEMMQEQGPVVFEEVTALTPRDNAHVDGVLDLVFHPDGSGAYFVAYRDGWIEERDADHQVTWARRFEVRRNNECGMLAIEVDPDFTDNQLLYVGLCVPSSGVALVSFTKADGPEVIPMTDTSLIFEIEKGANDYHNLGDLGWDEQKNLWITYGDGNNGPTPRMTTDLRGKLLRIRPYRDGRDGYAIPAGNPHRDDTSVRNEIIAWGIKSAFRSTYAKGTWFIADVGLDTWEEVTLVRLDSPGFDLGYPQCEGPEKLINYEPTGEDCDLGSSWLAPQIAYAHDPDQDVIKEDPLGDDSELEAWNVCGGVLYEGSKYGGQLTDRYLFSDINRGFVRTAKLEGTQLVDEKHLTHLVGIWVYAVGPDDYIYAVAANRLYRLVIEETP